MMVGSPKVGRVSTHEPSPRFSNPRHVARGRDVLGAWVVRLRFGGESDRVVVALGAIWQRSPLYPWLQLRHTQTCAVVAVFDPFDDTVTVLELTVGRPRPLQKLRGVLSAHGSRLAVVVGWCAILYRSLPVRPALCLTHARPFGTQ